MKYRERSEVQRWLFQRELEKFSGQPVFYLDECGVDHRLFRESGRAPRGERIYAAVPGKRRERTRIISAAGPGNGSRRWRFKAVATRRWWTFILNRSCCRCCRGAA